MNLVLKLLGLAPALIEGIRAVVRAIREGKARRRERELEEAETEETVPPKSPEP